MKQKFSFALIALLAVLFALTGCEGDAALTDYTDVPKYINQPDVDVPEVEFPEEEEEEEEDDSDIITEGTVYCLIEDDEGYVYCVSSVDVPSLTEASCNYIGEVVSSCSGY